METLTLEDKLNIAVKGLMDIANHYDPYHTSDGYWETGNYDDAYDIGVRTGENYFAGKATKILVQMGLLANIEASLVED